MLHIKQYEGSNVNARDDARIYNWLANGESGVISGYECKVISGNKVGISDGEVLVKGRMVESVDSEIDVKLYQNQTQGKGRIYVEIDTTKPLEEAVKLESYAGLNLPDLKQEEINHDGTKYQFEIAKYDTTNLGISNLKATAPKLTLQKERIDTLYKREQNSFQITSGIIGIRPSDTRWYYHRMGYLMNLEAHYLNGVTIPPRTTNIIGKLPYVPIVRQMQYLGRQDLACLIDYDGKISIRYTGANHYVGDIEIPNIVYLMY